MAKRWSVTSLLALALLGCLVGTEVEAQDWQKPVPPPQAPQSRQPPPPMSKGSPPPQAPQFRQPPPPPKAPQYPQYPQMPQVQPPPPPKAPQYPQAPQVQPPPPPKAPQYPQAPQVLPPPPPPKAPQYPQMPQVQPPPPPKAPQYPQMPQVQPPPPPKAPQYPQAPQFRQPPPPPKAPQYPQMPQVQPPPPPKAPQYPQMPQVQPPPPPKAPQYPQAPQVQPPPPPKLPQYPQAPQVLPPRPQFPQYPQAPKVQPPPPPKLPQYPQAPKVQPPPPPKLPQYPQAPQVQPPPPPKLPQYPQAPQVLPPRPQFPQYPQAPKVQPPPPPKLPQYPQAPQVLPPRPQFPQYPQAPKVQPPPPPKLPQYPQAPQVLPPRPQFPQYPQAPKVQPPPPPKVPQPPQAPKFSGYPRAFQDFKSPQEPQQPHQPYEPQKPNQPQQPHQPTSPQAAKQTSFLSCEVSEGQKIPCGGSDISAGACEAISCCFDGRQCYFGKAVTVQCTKDAQFIVVVARDATLPNIDLNSISLLGQGDGCTHVDSNSEFAIYQFPVTSCGSFVMEEPGVIIYENRMSSSYEVGVGPLGTITRDTTYELIFQCRYIGTSIETLVVEVLPGQNPPLPAAALGPIRVHLRLANGQCNTKGCNEVDAAYSSFYTEADYPVAKVLREPVYVEVLLLEKTDPLLVLTLGRCWTTASPNAHSLPQWDILTDGCPYRDDRYMSSLVPVGPSSGLDFPGHYRRFIFKMFTFVDPTTFDPLLNQVYLHCSTAVCAAAPGRSCEPSCSRKKRDVLAADQKTAEPKVVVSVGPVIMSSPEQ